jgi:hypothetical protein
MTVQPITTTTGRDVTPLGTGGQRAVDCWNTLTLLIERELSSAHAALLAEPLTNAARGTVDWYARWVGTAVRLSSLSVPERAAAQLRLDVMVGDIEVLADQLRSGNGEGDRFLGTMLSLALQIPGPDYVYAVGEQPVIVAWGHGTGGARPQAMVLTGRRRVAPDRRRWIVLPPPPKSLLGSGAEALPPRAAFPGPLASGAILCSLAFLFLLLAAGTWSSARPPPCAVAPDQLGLLAILQDAQARGSALQVERARLAEELGARRRQCTPAPAEKP